MSVECTVVETSERSLKETSTENRFSDSFNGEFRYNGGHSASDLSSHWTDCEKDGEAEAVHAGEMQFNLLKGVVNKKENSRFSLFSNSDHMGSSSSRHSTLSSSSEHNPHPPDLNRMMREQRGRTNTSTSTSKTTGTTSKRRNMTEKEIDDAVHNFIKREDLGKSVWGQVSGFFGGGNYDDDRTSAHSSDDTDINALFRQVYPAMKAKRLNSEYRQRKRRASVV